MNIIVLCPNLRCKAVLHVPEQARGRMIRCGQCGTQLMVPGNQGTGSGGKDSAQSESGKKQTVEGAASGGEQQT